MAIEGDYIVVGAEGNAGGRAYVFNKDEGGSDNWGLVKELTSDDIATSDDFGFGICASFLAELLYMSSIRPEKVLPLNISSS